MLAVIREDKREAARSGDGEAESTRLRRTHSLEKEAGQWAEYADCLTPLGKVLGKSGGLGDPLT